MIDDTNTPMRPRRARWPVVAALTAVAAGAMALTIAVAGLPGSPAAAPVPAASAAPAAPADVPSAAQGGDIVGAGWAAPAGQDGAGAPGNGRGFGRGFGPGSKLRGISITKIDGAKLSLVTVDGWTRTIDSTGATITRDGATIKVGDLAVGDEIVLRQKRAADGTFTVMAIRVVLPKVAGLVTDVGSSSLTLASPDGARIVVKVTSSTTYRVGKDKVEKSAVTAGMQAVASGTKAADGTLTATSITARASNLGGTVAAVSGTTITVTQRDGTKVTLKVTSTTTYRVRGVKDATLSDVKVDMRIVATGLRNADGSFTAAAVGAGVGGKHKGWGNWKWPGGKPDKSPAPAGTQKPSSDG